MFETKAVQVTESSLAGDLKLVRFHNVLKKGHTMLLQQVIRVPTLIIMARVDWKSAGFAAGSKTDALDWNDWKRPLISLLNAKLLRKRTYSI